MRAWSRLILPGLLSAAFLGAACADWFDLAGTLCNDDDSCGQGLTCHQGVCVRFGDAGTEPDAQAPSGADAGGFSFDAAGESPDAGTADDAGEIARDAAYLDAGTPDTGAIARDAGWERDAGVGSDAGSCRVEEIAAGSTHSCAVVSGQAWCWGSNESGKLGDGTTTPRLSPVQVGAALPNTVQRISAGGAHTCAIADGAAWCWGRNYEGQLGNDATTTEYTTPRPVPGLTGRVQAISAGNQHTCAIVDGEAWCWGRGNDGRLGNGGVANSPPGKVELNGIVTAISAGFAHTCAVLDDGTAWCWGYNAFGQLGNGAGDIGVHSVAPVQVNDLSSVTAISAGFEHTCAVSSGAALCWGNNTDGQLGNGTKNLSKVPASVNGLSTGVQSIAAGDRHTCVVVNGAAKCWGSNDLGRLGTTSVTETQVPRDVDNLGAGVSMVAARGDHSHGHSCAVVDGKALCWGFNSSGELGDNSYTERHQPTPVQLPCSTP